jgi:RNA polymerase sigma-B factor
MALPDPTAADAELFARVRTGDEETPAREELIRRYLPLAKRLARRYQRSEESLEDLIQVASLGLIKAIDRFDPGRDVAFSSYAVPTILGELKRHFRDRTWAVRVPRDLQETAWRVDQAITRLAADTGAAPSVGEIAAALELSEEQVLEGMEAGSAYRAASLDAPRATPEDEQGETIGDSVGVQEPGFERAEQRAMLEPLLKTISARERLVVRLRFVEDLTQAEIGERIGVSQMQVSRLIRHALARMRAGLD